MYGIGTRSVQNVFNIFMQLLKFLFLLNIDNVFFKALSIGSYNKQKPDISQPDFKQVSCLLRNKKNGTDTGLF